MEVMGLMLGQFIDDYTVCQPPPPPGGPHLPGMGLTFIVVWPRRGGGGGEFESGWAGSGSWWTRGGGYPGSVQGWAAKKPRVFRWFWVGFGLVGRGQPPEGGVLCGFSRCQVGGFGPGEQCRGSLRESMLPFQTLRGCLFGQKSLSSGDHS